VRTEALCSAVFLFQSPVWRNTSHMTSFPALQCVPPSICDINFLHSFLKLHLFLYLFSLSFCVCVWERERERERESMVWYGMDACVYLILLGLSGSTSSLALTLALNEEMWIINFYSSLKGIPQYIKKKQTYFVLLAESISLTMIT